jgi:hypothetical protein
LGLPFSDNVIRRASSHVSSLVAGLSSPEKTASTKPVVGLHPLRSSSGQIIVAALLSQLPYCGFGIRKSRRDIRQVRAIRIILDPVPSAYREKISLHRSILAETLRRRGNSVVTNNSVIGPMLVTTTGALAVQL